MTDGIIQEVFKMYSNRKLLDDKNLRVIQQELIEKIKQELNQHFDCLDDACSLRTHLIGDNQE